MEDTLNIALIQTSLIWQDPEANRMQLKQRIDTISDSVDLVVLPEMFTTGFTMKPSECYDTMDGETIRWMKAIASGKNCAITGSLVIRENDKFYNRLVFVKPDGEIATYDKRHLFSLAGEDEVYTSGNDRLLVEIKGFRICPLVCYDLRFPAFSRNTEDFDVLLYVANWPLERIPAWDALLKARAIENICYVVGVNRTGTDMSESEYPGHSQVFDYLGEIALSAWENEGVFAICLEKKPLMKIREKLGFLNDRDDITVK